jgi:metallo-beta-lactamase class B
MPKLLFTKIILLLFVFTNCKSSQIVSNYETDSLKIEKISDHVFVHISYLSTKNFGNVPCNGMVLINKGKAIIFDTPTDDAVAMELINWVEKSLHCKIEAIITSHFHVDCLGGLNAFHQRGIPSFASSKTIELAKSKNKIVPQNGFENYLELKLGNKKVISEFVGEGHTIDNIIGYFPSEKTLFGGCLIKAIGAGKGNLEDANTEDWAASVQKIKTKYKDIKVVVPGHGKSGGEDLLDFTIDLFSK